MPRKEKTLKMRLRTEHEQSKWALHKALKDFKDTALRMGFYDSTQMFDEIQDEIKAVFDYSIVIL